MISAIALDMGSTSIKAGLLDVHGRLAGIVTQPVPPVRVQDGRYESDALAYAELADQVLAACLSQTTGRPPLGMCSQRSSFLLWEKSGGNPVTPLISWQDNRGEQSCVELQADAAVISELSGLRLTPYFFAPKLRVLLQENPGWLENLHSGRWMAGTLDSYLIWRWTAGAQHITDASMAARTLLMDIRTQQWSPVLCGLFGLPSAILPRITPSAELQLALGNGLILQASVGDQSAALIGSVGNERGVALVNLGTGGFVIRHLPDAQLDTSGYLHTLVFQDSARRAHFAAEGTLNSISAALAPYPVADCRVEDFAANDIFCLAEPSGLGAPYFRKDLTLQFSGPVGHLSPRDIGCLLLEAIIFRVTRILEDFHLADKIQQVYLSGGLSELGCLQQGIALCAPYALFRLEQRDASLLGAALLALGKQSAVQTTVTRVEISGNNTQLQLKYLRWKRWLDALLAAQA